MMEREAQFAREFDRMESLRAAGAERGSIDDSEMADYLEIVNWLEAEAEAAPMPRGLYFTRALIRRLNHRKRIWWGGGLALAASILIAFLLIGVPESQPAHALVIDSQLLDRALMNQTKDEMVEYLQTTERLLLAMRDYEVACSEDRMDVAPEKDLAKNLLLRQKHFSPLMNQPEFFQARHLFSQLERILVDLNSMESCTDPGEIDFINKHISKNRILSKLRLVAQEIQVS